MRETAIARRSRLALGSPARNLPHLSVALAFAAGAVLIAPAAEARITRIEITATERPTFGGFSWPNVGQYEKIVGKASGEVNPHDRQNRDIVDIEFAPRNDRGNVEYSWRERPRR